MRRFIKLTNHIQVSVLNQRRVCGDLTSKMLDFFSWWFSSYLALVQSNVSFLGKLDLQLPIIWLLVNDLKSCIAAVGLPAVGQQMRVFIFTDPLQPRDLAERLDISWEARIKIWRRRRLAEWRKVNTERRW